MTFLLFDNHAHAMCVTREQLFYDDLYSYNRFGPSRLGAGLAAMFPGLPSVDVTEIDALPGALRTALDTEGPSVISVSVPPTKFRRSQRSWVRPRRVLKRRNLFRQSQP